MADSIGELVVAIAAGLVASALCIGGIVLATEVPQTMNTSVYHAQVRRVEAVDDQYLVFTELDNGQKRVFQNEDFYIKGKVNSSDIYNDLEEGGDYCFKTVGWRVPALSWYENIVDYKDAAPGVPCDF